MLKGLVFNILYLFVLTLVGVLIVTAYNYFYPVDVTSEASVLTVALIFTLFVIYRLFKDADFIHIDRGTPARLKRYIPLRIV